MLAASPGATCQTKHTKSGLPCQLPVSVEPGQPAPQQKPTVCLRPLSFKSGSFSFLESGTALAARAAFAATVAAEETAEAAPEAALAAALAAALVFHLMQASTNAETPESMRSGQNPQLSLWT